MGPSTGLVRPRRLGGYKKMRTRSPARRVGWRDDAPVHSRIVKTWPDCTPAIGRSMRKRSSTAGTPRSRIGGLCAPPYVELAASVSGGLDSLCASAGESLRFAISASVVRTVPAKIIPARRARCFHWGPRARSAAAWSEGVAAKAGAKRQRQRKRPMQTRATAGSLLNARRADTRIVRLLSGRDGPGEVLGVTSM